jgi:hypothetical protein
MRFRVERICHTDSMSAVPLEKVRFDLLASAESIRKEGHAVEAQELYLVVGIENMDVTVYPSGRVLFHPMSDKKRAKELAQRLFALMVLE